MRFIAPTLLVLVFLTPSVAVAEDLPSSTPTLQEVRDALETKANASEVKAMVDTTHTIAENIGFGIGPIFALIGTYAHFVYAEVLTNLLVLLKQ